MARRRSHPNSVFELVRSRPFVGVTAVALALAAVAMVKRWHVNRTELMRREVGRLEARVRALQERERDLRVRLAQRQDPAFLEQQIRRFGLDLGPPSEEQIVTIEEPDWLVNLGRGGEVRAGEGRSGHVFDPGSAGPAGLGGGPVLGDSRRGAP